MYERILVPLDGSAYSEEILPYAAGMVEATGARMSLMRVARDRREAAEAGGYLDGKALELAANVVPVRTGVVEEGILAETQRGGPTLIAMTSHGRTGLLRSLLGSVASGIVRQLRRPVLVYRPTGHREDAGRAIRISTVMLGLDGSEFSEAMEPAAAGLAKWLGAQLVVVQAIGVEARVPAGIPSGDVLESSYVRRRAEGIAREYAVAPEWDVLRGEAADALCGYVAGRRDIILAMSSHGRSGLGQTLLGSVAAGCLRRAGVPILVRAAGPA